jgi:flagellar biosynthesis protein
MSPEEAPAKRQKVVALKYDPAKQSAPRILAKGQGGIAQKILDMAKTKGIPLYQDPELVEILSQLDVGLEIQPELYQAVAEVLIFIYKTNQKKMKAAQAAPGLLKAASKS